MVLKFFKPCYTLKSAHALEHACVSVGSPRSSVAGAAAAGAFVLAVPSELSAACASSLVSKPARRTRPRCSESGD